MSGTGPPFPLPLQEIARRHSAVFPQEPFDLENVKALLYVWKELHGDIHGSGPVPAYLRGLGFVKLLDVLDVMHPHKAFRKSFDVAYWLLCQLRLEELCISWANLRYLFDRHSCDRRPVNCISSSHSPIRGKVHVRPMTDYERSIFEPVVGPDRLPSRLAIDNAFDEPVVHKRSHRRYRPGNGIIESEGEGYEIDSSVLCRCPGYDRGTPVGEGCYWRSAPLPEF